MATIRTEGPSPANAPTAKTAAERKRIPMSVPQRKLEVPEIAGYHQHWFLESRVPRAIQGGYEFVDSSETDINQRGIGADGATSGNMDLGSRVTMIGGAGTDGKPEQLVLMKIREEWWLEDQKARDAVSMNVVDSIRKRKPAVVGDDAAQSYVKTSLLETHTKHRRS